MASKLLPELVEEILLRVPPDEPAHLVRAALVCKPWHRILSNRQFLRRYRSFHRSPPLLGYIHNLYYDLRKGGQFVPTTTASPVSMPVIGCSWWAIDSRHGRVLVNALGDPCRLIVWDPITGEQQDVSKPPYLHSISTSTYAVLCAVDGCDHLDCHGGPFLVVLVETNNLDDDPLTWVRVYSSDTGVWSAPTYNIDVEFYLKEFDEPGVLAGDALYFTFGDGCWTMSGILKYDLCKHELSMINNVPGVDELIAKSLIKLEDGGLGVVSILDNCIYMWSRPDSTGGWVKHRVMELDMLLHKQSCRSRVIGIAEGTNTIFITTYAGIFRVDLKSSEEGWRKQVAQLSDVTLHELLHSQDFAEVDCHRRENAVVHILTMSCWLESLSKK